MLGRHKPHLFQMVTKHLFCFKILKLNGATTDSKHPDDLQYDPEGGLGFLSGLIVDAHFR
jgi:hypothetical protein